MEEHRPAVTVSDGQRVFEHCLVIAIVISVFVLGLFETEIPNPGIMLDLLAIVFLTFIGVRLIVAFPPGDRVLGTLSRYSAAAIVALSLPYLADLVKGGRTVLTGTIVYANFYVLAILLIAGGAVFLLRSDGVRARLLSAAVWALSAVLVIAAASVSVWMRFTDVRSGNLYFWAYTALLFAGLLVALGALRRFGKHFGGLREFTHDLSMSCLLLFVAAGPYVYGPMLVARGLTDAHRAAATGHYLVFAALAALYVTFDHVLVARATSGKTEKGGGEGK